MIVAIIPTMVAEPSFFVHQTAMIKAVKPIKSQRKGKPNMLKKIGENIELSTPQRMRRSLLLLCLCS